MNIEKVKMLDDTLDICEKGFYHTDDGNEVKLRFTKSEMEEAIVYLPDDIKRIELHAGGKVRNVAAVQEEASCRKSGGALVSCENTDSYALARKHAGDDSYTAAVADRVLVLNLANAVHKGGGVRNGATAQEEDLCRKSSLLLSLESKAANAYYEYNRRQRAYLGSDAVIINPNVEIIKDETGRPLNKSVVVSVITCAAPNLRMGMQGLTDAEYQQLLYARIYGMFTVAAHAGYKKLVMGAFGCGAFKNDPVVVSDIYARVMKEFTYNGMGLDELFERVDFAVLDRGNALGNFEAFERRMGEFGRKEKTKFTFFWKDNEENGIFSNWYQRKVVVDDFEYFCAEQYMMAQKAKMFHDSERYTQILRAKTPWECKDLGRKVTPFDSDKWNAARYDVVKAVNKAKYEQNPDLMKALLATGDSVIAEASPKDKVWGIGLDAAKAVTVPMDKWRGKNLLGKALMELRKEFGGGCAAENEDVSDGCVSGHEDIGSKSTAGHTEIKLVKGDITKLTDVDVIVNAANESLLGGSGVDGAIHMAAGPDLVKECAKLNGCEPGGAKITGAYRIKCKKIIHTVGPRWHGGNYDEEKTLADAYRNSLQLAVDNGLKSVAFPSISTGVFNFPLERAAEIAIKTAQKFADENPGRLDVIEWVLFDDKTYGAYERVLGR